MECTVILQYDNCSGLLKIRHKKCKQLTAVSTSSKCLSLSKKTLTQASVGDSTWFSGIVVQSDQAITTNTIWTVDQTVDVE